ncbi:MAG: hypothetical protein JNM41_04385 [Flavipsychrobacter sp.]|nr:hypothetical protein [Flavipsychrobacter sp.]
MMKFAMFVFFGAILIGVYISFRKQDVSAWNVAVGTVDRLYSPDGSEMALTYVVNGVSFSDGGGALQGTTYGDKYLVLYNPNNPSECIINASSPFFYKNENLAKTKGQIVGRVRSKKKRDKEGQFFEYEYLVDGVRYRREQQYLTCGRPNSILKREMEFLVKYSIEFPERAVMVVDSVNSYVFFELSCADHSKLKIDSLTAK